MSVVIQVDRLSKQYRLGTIGGKRLVDDVNRWWARIRGKEDPLSKVGSAPQTSDLRHLTSDCVWALKDVSFEVKQGEVLGIIGRNGAGKSTLLKILSRVTAPTSGEVRVKGRIASLLEVGTGFHPELTGRENIFLNGAILGMTKAEIRSKFDEIVAFAETDKFIDTPVKRYSSGMHVRLAFAVAAHLEPEILIIDEVLAVGDAPFQKKCLGKMSEVAEHGRTVLFVSHNLAALKALCHNGVLLANGMLDAQGKIDGMVDRYSKTSYERSRSGAGKFPAYNHEHGLCLAACSAELHLNGEHFDLKIHCDIQTSQPLKNIGVGITLYTLEGTKVSMIDPFVTNHTIKELNGRCRCTLTCTAVDNYLAGGDYVLEVWLEKPLVMYFLRVKEAAIISIPARDLFLTGKPFEVARNGLVPLPMRITTANGNSGV